MAPINEHAVATVFAAQVLSGDEKTILVEAGSFTPTRWFLEHAANELHNESKQPPKKKSRQLKQQATDEPYRPASLPPSGDDDIVIHKATLDFQFPETLNATLPKKRAIDDDVEFDGASEVLVMPHGIEDDRSGSRLRLTTSRKQDSVLLVECSAISQTFIDALRRIARPEQLSAAYSGQRLRNNPATNLRCTLKRSSSRPDNVVRLEASVSWHSGVSAFPAGMPVGKARVYEDYGLLEQAYYDQARLEVDHTQPWAPSDFYDSVHVPSQELDTTDINDNILDNELYPFQKRTVKWMLRREGVFVKDGLVEEVPVSERLGEKLNFYSEVHDVYGQKCYVNHLQGIIRRDMPVEHEELSGGLLAEEMGLGKTVELMALLKLHPRPDFSLEGVRDESSDTAVTPSKATLIITPPTILQQWRSELSRQAPSLRVFQYEGIPGGGKRAMAEADVIRDLTTKYDVVLATYSTLAREIHFAQDPPDRNMRHARKFERTRSPLVQIQWWRICLDEAQMVESGVTAAARVACRLPRVHSWAVTGTPLRKNVQDLHGLLIFLRYRPLNNDVRLWIHLITNHRHLFRRIFREMALRHTKARVRDELHLPPQKRVVLTVPFSAVEQQHYSTLFAEMCNDISLHNDGSPKDAGWDPQDPSTLEAMRNWLVRLRQTCLHPQVGGRNRKALGRRQGPLRTVSEVLEVMIDQNETNTRVEERAVLQSELIRAHILGSNREDEHRSEKALDIYKNAMNTSATLVQEARDRLAAAKAAATEKGENIAETDDEDSASESTPILGRLRNNLRTALQLQHVCTFFAATACYQIKSNEALTKADSEEFKRLEEQENYLYDSAKLLRKEILSDTSRKAEVLMRKIKDLQDKNTLTRMPAIKDLNMGGIESRRIVEKSEELFDVIRGQAHVISEWRSKMAEYLLKPLVDEDEEGIETTGEEYETSTKQQDELYVYFDAVKAIQADLNTFITGEDAPLIDHEVKILIRDANWYLDPDIEFDSVVHAPELLLKLLTERNKFRSRKVDVGSVRGLIQEVRALEGSMQHSSRGETERALMRGQLNALQKIFSEYSKALVGLEKEVDLFRSAQNQRLEFYRQLQELSDAVAPYKEELDEHLDVAALEAVLKREDHLTNKLAQLKTKHRFLYHLREESGSNDSPKICVICQCPFENGVLTVCGHQYCKECIVHWWSQHRSCPVCKRNLVQADFHNITYKPRELKAQEEVQSGFSSPGLQPSPSSGSLSHQSSIYADVDTKLMNEIKSMDLPSSYGTKIDTVGRHLHWIREHDPGAKSIVFSQYREFLDVLGTALHEFKIGYSRLGRYGAVEKFKRDPSIDCLLLDAKTDSSGLTLVNATHVFICEPLIQTAVELQAIARVHRIGQMQPTTVWMYLVNDTVEESVYEISVSRRLEHVQSRERQPRHGKSRSATPGPLQENAIDAANSEEMQSAPISKLLVAGKSGGELVENDDLWQCLFGKVQKANSRPSVGLEQDVERYLRAEAAEQRQAAAETDA